MEIRDFDLHTLSALSYRMRTCEFGGTWNPTALILEFSGVYGWGSQGNGDADFIAAIKAAALEVLHVEAVVFDFREMSYEWGNRIWEVLHCRRPDGDTSLPVAMVISDECRPGFAGCTKMVPPMFESLEQALRFVEGPSREYLTDLMHGID
ncbi:hypothetical protein J0H58_12875 [bacterium]|nr:hypothetical protein [bacterium]